MPGGPCRRRRTQLGSRLGSRSVRGHLRSYGEEAGTDRRTVLRLQMLRPIRPERESLEFRIRIVTRVSEKCFQSDTRLSSPELGDSVSRRYSHVKRRSVVQNDVRKLVAHTHEMPFGRELDRELRRSRPSPRSRRMARRSSSQPMYLRPLTSKRPNQSWVAVIAWRRNEATRFNVASRRRASSATSDARLPRNHIRNPSRDRLTLHRRKGHGLAERSSDAGLQPSPDERNAFASCKGSEAMRRPARYWLICLCANRRCLGSELSISAERASARIRASLPCRRAGSQGRMSVGARAVIEGYDVGPAKQGEACQSLGRIKEGWNVRRRGSPVDAVLGLTREDNDHLLRRVPRRPCGSEQSLCGVR